MALLHSDLRFGSPDDIYEAIISLADGLDDRAAHTALAAFALAGQPHRRRAGGPRGDRSGSPALKDYPEAPRLGGHDPAGKVFQVGGALDRCARS
jgi:hypothetical protein